MYSTLLVLSRNIFFYKTLKLADNFETRIYLMFFHFSIILTIFKDIKKKFKQNNYDSLFNNIENNLRELGFGDVSVNKKMKDLNKILYDILLKIDLSATSKSKIKINDKIIFKYFSHKEVKKEPDFENLIKYFIDFFNFCFELSLDNMIREAINYKVNYGSS